MKNIRWILLLILVFVSTQCKTMKQTKVPKTTPITYTEEESNDAKQRFSQHTLIIFYDQEIGSDYLMKAIKVYGASIIYKYQNFNGMAISIPKGKKLEEAIAYFQKIKGVLSVNKDQIYKLDSTN
jgi:hypothetical protein